MPGSTGHWLKPTKAGYAPRCVVSVWVEPDIACGAPEGTKVLPAKGGRVHAAWRRQTRGKWSKVEERSWDHHADFWAWLDRWCFSKRRAWIVAPVASDALTMLGFWKRATAMGARLKGQMAEGMARRTVPLADAAFTFDRIVLRGRPDIISYSLHNKRYTWVSLSNYLACDSPALIKLVGGTWLSSRSTLAPSADSTLTPMERCTLHLAAFIRLGTWWTGLKAGGFGHTIGSCAKSYMLSRMPKKSICTHKDERLTKLERLACHGGRASVWYYGDVIHRDHVPGEKASEPPRSSPWLMDDTLYQVDIRSMYPYLMTQIDMPVEKKSFSYTETPASVRDLLRSYCVVASVELNTDEAEYPHRIGERIVYPVGRFNAVLCGAELRRALDMGHVTQVYSAGIYAAGKPFARAAQELLDMRGRVDAATDPGWEQMVKLLANSMTGKLAQKGSRLIARPKKGAEKEWGYWIELDPTTGRPTRFEARAGMVWEESKEVVTIGTLTACYAHVTSAGRELMRSLRAALPARSVVAQDTDGLWVTSTGRDTLARSGYLHGRGPGSLRICGSSTRSRFYSPKHYYAASEWTLAGMHSPVHMAGTLSFTDEWVSNLVRSSSPFPPDFVHYHTRDVALDILQVDGTVAPDGWQVPLMLPRSPRGSRGLQDDQTPVEHPSLPDCA